MGTAPNALKDLLCKIIHASWLLLKTVVPEIQKITDYVQPVTQVIICKMLKHVLKFITYAIISILPIKSAELAEKAQTWTMECAKTPIVFNLTILNVPNALVTTSFYHQKIFASTRIPTVWISTLKAGVCHAKLATHYLIRNPVF